MFLEKMEQIMETRSMRPFYNNISELESRETDLFSLFDFTLFKLCEETYFKWGKLLRSTGMHAEKNPDLSRARPSAKHLFRLKNTSCDLRKGYKNDRGKNGVRETLNVGKTILERVFTCIATTTALYDQVQFEDEDLNSTALARCFTKLKRADTSKRRST